MNARTTPDAVKRRKAATDLEAALLSAALQSAEAADEVLDRAVRTDFGDSRNRLVFEAIAHLRGINAVPDVFAVAAELERRGQSAVVGGLPALMELNDHASSYHLIDHHSKMVRGFAELRAVAGIAAGILRDASEADWSEAAVLADTFAERIAAVGLAGKDADQGLLYDAAGAVLRKLKATLEGGPPAAPSLPTPLATLNRYMQWRPGCSYVIAGRPGGGKTTFLQAFSVDAARRTGGIVVYFSVEMPTESMALRALSAEAGVPTIAIERGEVDARQLDRLLHAQKGMSAGQVWVYHQPRMSIGAVGAVTRRLARKGAPIALIVVDYLQRFRPVEANPNRVQVLEDMAGEALAVCQVHRCPVLIGSQLNREGELKGADAPLEDASGVLYVEREERTATLEIKKNRFGEARIVAPGSRIAEPIKVQVGFDPETGRVYDLSR